MQKYIRTAEIRQTFICNIIHFFFYFFHLSLSPLDFFKKKKIKVKEHSVNLADIQTAVLCTVFLFCSFPTSEVEKQRKKKTEKQQLLGTEKQKNQLIREKIYTFFYIFACSLLFTTDKIQTLLNL